MKTKRLIPVLLVPIAFVLCFCTACGGGENTSVTVQETTAASTEAPADVTTEAPADATTAARETTEAVTTVPKPDGPPSAYQQIPTTKEQ